VALTIAVATPPLWTTRRLDWLPWGLETYLNGVHTFGAPKGYFFPIFPWTGFAFAGLAVGFLLLSDWARRRETLTFALLPAAGACLFATGRALDRHPRQLYAVYDFWHTSPNYFLMRVGVLLLITGAAYAWCRWGLAQRGFSPIIQLGQTSLMVYWIHIEFVYGRLIILPSHANSIPRASLGLAFIIVFMVVLSLIRTGTKGRSLKEVLMLRRPATKAAAGS
jgi:hypothetical protein